MNETMKKILLVFGVIFSIVLVSTLLLMLLLNGTPKEKGGKEQSFFDSFKSAHTDDDIIQYVKKEHDIDISVLDNYGKKHLKTGDGGFATVVTNDNVRFEVFINSFGAITGDNYKYILAVPEILGVIDESGDLDEITRSGFKDVEILTDDETQTLEVLLKIPLSLHLADEQFMERLKIAHHKINEWNDSIQAEYDLMFDTLKLSYEQVDDKDAPITGTLFIDMHEDLNTIEEIEQYIIQRNDKVIAGLFIHEDIKQIETISEGLPGKIVFEPYYQETALQCREFASFDTCESYAVAIALDEDHDLEDLQSFRYDNEQVKDDLFKVIQQIQTVDLPIVTLVIQKLYIPENIENQDYPENVLLENNPEEHFSYKTVEIRDITTIESVSDIKFHPYVTKP